jgi:hypothetical protein
MNRSYSKIRHILESNLKMEKRLLNEQSTKPKTKLITGGSGFNFLINKSTDLNPALSLDFLPKCYEYKSESGVRDSEIEHYIDYTNVYGKVPGTGIPIPYESSDLKHMIQLLQGSGTPGPLGGNFTEVGDLATRWVKIGDSYYPTVELIRSKFTKMKGKSLYDVLTKKATDSEEDMEQKQRILGILSNAYKTWIDCAAGIKKQA